MRCQRFNYGIVLTSYKLIVWDKDDVRIEELPEIRSINWWKEWVDSGKVDVLDEFEVEISDGKNVWVACELDFSRDKL